MRGQECAGEVIHHGLAVVSSPQLTPETWVYPYYTEAPAHEDDL